MAKVIYGGYGSVVDLEGDNLLVSSFSLSNLQGVITSGTSYAGSFAPEELNKLALRSPSYTDYDEINLNLTYYATKEQLKVILKWLKTRNESKKIRVRTGSTGAITLNDCMFESIAIACGQNSVISISLSLWGTSEDYSNGVLGGLISQHGIGNLDSYKTTWENNVFSTNHLIPYWATSVDAFSADIGILSWNLDFSQELVKKHYCNGMDSEVKTDYPKDVFVGLLSSSISLDVLFSDTPVVYDDYFTNELSNKLVSLSIVGDSMITFNKLILTTMSPLITEENTPYGMSCSYDIFKITEIKD